MKTATPTCFPREGTYWFSGIHVDLQCGTPGAKIHYTVNGEVPTLDSPVYERELGLIPLKSASELYKSVTTQTIIRAIAVAEGMEPSEPETFTYQVVCDARTKYRYHVLRQGEDLADLYCIEDFDADKMFLFVGTKRALLIDTGYDPDGDMKSLVDTLCHGIPYDVVISHGHPDHVQQANNFIQAGVPVYMNNLDEELLPLFDYSILPDYRDMQDGMIFDLGNSVIDFYHVPGHTPGSMIAVERQSGYCFSSDALGSNRLEKPDTGWVQFDTPCCALDCVLAQVQKFRWRTKGRLTKLFSGHNTYALEADLYLDNLEAAIQNVIDHGESVLKPTLRSTEECMGSSKIAVCGNHVYDPDWAAVNVGHIFSDGFQPNKNTDLNWIGVKNGSLSPAFDRHITEYTLACKDAAVTLTAITSSAQSTVHLNGKRIISKQDVSLDVVSGEQLLFDVESPDRTAHKCYILTIT